MKDKVIEGIAGQLGQQFQLHPLVALVIVALVSTAFGAVGQMLWNWAGRVWSRRKYGNWAIVVSGGKTGQHWHAPIDMEIIRNLYRGNFVVFKRDLGTMLSGEGNVPFTFGVPVAQPVTARPPEAQGLTIDRKARTITIDFNKTRGVAPVA